MATLLAEIFGFLVVLAVLYRYIRPPLRAAMAARQAAIRAQFEEAREAKEQAEAAEARYARSISGAQTEAEQIKESSRDQGRQIVEEMRAKAEQEAERIAERGRQQLLADRDALVRRLRAEMGALAVQLADRIVRDALSDRDRQSATVERFLDDLEQRSAAAPAPASPAGEAV